MSSQSGTAAICVAARAAGAELARARVVAHLDDIANLRVVAGDADAAAVDGDVAVVDHLARRAARGGQAEPEDDVVEPRLEELKQGLARDAATPQCDLVVAPELLLEQTVT